jgi:preprotein translocase subunit SecA
MANLLGRLFSQNESAAFVKTAGPLVAKALTFEEGLMGLSKEDLQKRLAQVKERAGGAPQNEEDVAETFAIVREAARRTLKERHYDVQLIGGLALTRGKIAEMRTGEGKTLVATLAAVTRALAGKGVHIVTVNDYLARRDGAWMGQVYDYLGLTLGIVTSSGSYLYDPSHVPAEEDAERDVEGSFRVFYDFLRPVSKKEAYSADLIYATNNELGFDYLRDNTAYEEAQIVNERGYHFAIIDEIDSILIDEARTPLIISGPAQDAGGLYERFASIVATFAEGSEYTVDEKQHAVQITEEGMKKAETALGLENLYAEGGMRYAHHLDTAVRAKALFHKDKEYVVKDGEVVIVDEFTGRLQPGRRWSEGLHQAVEAKEGVAIRKETRTYASVTFQNYFRLYESLAGMTGTGLSSEEEFFTVYGLEVIAIPTNRVVARKDHEDLIFQNNAGKYKALAREVQTRHEKGQPVLIGTVSIEDNEVVGKYLKDAGIPHEMLNAKNHEREGEIIAQAGRKGRVTVATNLAGRGVDIKLGGVPANETERAEVLQAGGLLVIGTERHEARRIDNQLRGRSGRQGDPGETQFLVSLEDKLMRVFASDMVKKVMGTFKIPEDEPIGSGIISKALETAQKRIEGFNFDARKQVLAYDDVLNTQRLAVYARRRTALRGSGEDIDTALRAIIGDDEALLASYEEKRKEFGEEQFTSIARRLILQVTDAHWLEQLETMEYLRRSVSLRAYGQRDPLIEYRREGLARFKVMEADIENAIRSAIPRIARMDEAKMRAQEEKARRAVLSASEAGKSGGDAGPVVKADTYGRNDLVTITNGTETKEVKYKKAEALLSEGWTIVQKTP